MCVCVCVTESALSTQIGGCIYMYHISTITSIRCNKFISCDIIYCHLSPLYLGHANATKRQTTLTRWIGRLIHTTCIHTTLYQRTNQPFFFCLWWSFEALFVGSGANFKSDIPKWPLMLVKTRSGTRAFFIFPLFPLSFIIFTFSDSDFDLFICFYYAFAPFSTEASMICLIFPIKSTHNL